MSKVIKIENKLEAYFYMEYLERAIGNNSDFKGTTIKQLGARLSGKTTSDNIALIRAILASRKKKVRLAVFIFRMRHKDVIQAGNDITRLFLKYKLPTIINRGRGLIKIGTTRIYFKGCYTTNSTEISMLGQAIQSGTDYGIIVFEEAKEFNRETVDAVLVAIRGIKYQTVIFRSNPYLLTNGFVQECYKEVMVDEKNMLEGEGNQLEEKGNTLYHYMRATVNSFIDKPNLEYLNRILKDNPNLAKTEYYGLPGTSSGMVFAPILHKIKTEFEMKKGDEFTAGVDVGHVSSAMTASLRALEPLHIGKVGEYYHSNKEQKFLESIELAQEILSFFALQKERFKFKELDCFVDCADPGFISLLNTEARKQGKEWFLARPCKKIKVENRISGYTYIINKQIIGIHKSCKKTMQELSMLAYDEKAEDDKVKLVKQNDHTWDADMYALTPYMRRYNNYDLL